jgi:multisubunit Na+/H+ antiporter MnhB subunit
MPTDAVLDAVLAAALVWVAWRVLTVAEDAAAAVLFIVLGLLMALVWARLAAPDIALAEAAIGAGVTGALVLDAVGHLGGGSDGRARSVGRRVVVVATVLCAALAGGIGWAVLRLPPDAPGLAAAVARVIPDTGATNPVTAVLLDLRAYDTFLELGVLLLAAIAALAVRRTVDLRDVEPDARDDLLLSALTRLGVPVMVLVGGYLLWAGTQAPGGAFQAGAVLAGAAILVLVAGGRGVVALPAGPLRVGLASGFAAFLVVAWVLLVAGRRLLDLIPDVAEATIVGVEVAVTVAVGVGLAALFAAARQPADVER